jgi:hypothetical protein
VQKGGSQFLKRRRRLSGGPWANSDRYLLSAIPKANARSSIPPAFYYTVSFICQFRVDSPTSQNPEIITGRYIFLC